MAVKISLELITQLRERTGLGLMDCRKALEAAGGDIEQAAEELRKKGAAVAAKRSGNETSQGLVHAYIHPGAQMGVLVEVNCETDFVARTEQLQQFARDLCLHIAASKPMYLSPEQVDPKFLEHEKEIFRAQLIDSGKPEKVIGQILEGKVAKLYSDICLLQQQFVKNDQMTVTEVLNDLVARLGEKIVIRRFSRFEVGH
jgi:elongation factor Ts